MTAPSPLALPDPWDLVAAAYADEVVPMFEAFAREALARAGVAPGMHVVDVAAGPGTLSFLAAAQGAKVSAIDFSPEMLGKLRARAEREQVDAIDASVGDGMALPYSDASFDAGFSMFGLMFFPDRDAGFRELARVLRPGARAVVSSWVSLERLPLMAAAMSTVGELVPGPQPPPRELPLVEPEKCRAEMSAGGFSGVEVIEHVVSVEVPSVREMMGSFERTNAPIVLIRRRVGDAWGGIFEEAVRRLEQRFGPGPQTLAMPANLTIGVRA